MNPDANIRPVPIREASMTEPRKKTDDAAVTRQGASFWTTLVLTVLAVVLVSLIIYPFATALFVGAVLAGALHIPYEKLVARLGGRRQLSAVITTFLVLLILILPVASLTVVLAQEAADGGAYVARTLRSEGVEGLVDDLPAPLRSLAHKILGQLPQDEDALKQLGQAQGGRAASAVGGVLSATWGVLVQMVMMLIAFFFFLVDGSRLVDWLEEVLPLRRGQTRALLADFRKVSVAVLVSSVATAAVQALVALVGYLIARIPNPFFFTLVTFVVGLVPAVGGGAVTVAAAAILFLTGHTGYAIFLAIWGIVAVGLSDNVVKPFLIRGGLEMHGAVVFFALLGGLAYFGAVGLLAGPLIISFFLAVIRMWQRELELRPA
jgi:predicted PurR-regulated permease PerM